jgi:hypothetical protein
VSPLTPYLAIGALVVTIATGAGGYFAGRSHQRDADDAAISKERERSDAESRADGLTLSNMAGSIGGIVASTLNRGDQRAAPIILGMHDAAATSSLATDACTVPALVRDGAAALGRAANSAADLADSASLIAVGGASPTPAGGQSKQPL